MVANPTPAVSGSARMRLYQWASERVSGLGGQDRIKISDILEEAREKFLTDPAWTHQFVRDCLDEMTRSVIAAAVADTRGEYKAFVFKDEVMAASVYANQTSKEAAQLSSKLMQKWGSWMEHTGTGHVRLLDMTRAELLKAAELRERRAADELEKAQLWRQMAARMTSDDLVVREVFSLIDIESMSSAIRREGGTFRDPTVTPSDEDGEPQG